jgi:Cu/Ag efflux protein CusF
MKQLGAIALAVVSTLIYVSPAVAEDKPAQAARHVRSMSQTVTAQATVEAIDQQTRHVTLKTEDGKSMTIVADARVKNLAQVHVGDVVEVAYREALAIDVIPGGAPASTVVEGAAGTAKPGTKPAAAGARRVTVTATIEAIDEATQHVTLRGPEGKTMEVKVQNPENLKKGKVGDSVRLTYTEAVAISVRKAEK